MYMMQARKGIRVEKKTTGLQAWKEILWLQQEEMLKNQGGSVYIAGKDVSTVHYVWSLEAAVLWSNLLGRFSEHRCKAIKGLSVKFLTGEALTSVSSLCSCQKRYYNQQQLHTLD